MASSTRFKSRAFRYRRGDQNAAMLRSRFWSKDMRSDPNQRETYSNVFSRCYCPELLTKVITVVAVGQETWLTALRGGKFTTKRRGNVTSCFTLQFALVNFRRTSELEAIITCTVHSFESISNLPLTFSHYNCQQRNPTSSTLIITGVKLLHRICSQCQQDVVKFQWAYEAMLYVEDSVLPHTSTVFTSLTKRIWQWLIYYTLNMADAYTTNQSWFYSSLYCHNPDRFLLRESFSSRSSW